MADCLVVIDVQKGFIFDKTQWVIPRIEKLMRQRPFDFVIATKFMNKNDSIFRKFLDYERMSSEREQLLASDLVWERADFILEKTGYSCFTHEFVSFIEERKITKLYFVGVDIDACVLKSAFDCFEYGIDFAVVTDCCATAGGDSFFSKALDIMKRNLGNRQLCNSDALMSYSDLSGAELCD